MLSDGNVHSTVVGWLKILLPMGALALLSTMFLFARQTGEAPAIPFAELDEMAREQLISAPRFSGVADDGSVIQITAQDAKPDGPDLNNLTINRPRLSLDAADGTSLEIFAGAGVIDNAEQTARLDGLARLETSSGFTMETAGLVADLQTGEVRSLGRLEVQAPFGSVTAGAVSILVTNDSLGQQMRFTDGVKLVYDAANAEGTTE